MGSVIDVDQSNFQADTRAVMEGVFTLLGDDDPLARQYRELVGAG